MSWATNSSRRKAPFLADFDTPTGEFADAAVHVEHRKRMVESITRHARSQGLDANEELVARYYDWFLRWYEGVLATGYLINRTGVQRITLENW